MPKAVAAMIANSQAHPPAVSLLPGSHAEALTAAFSHWRAPGALTAPGLDRAPVRACGADDVPRSARPCDLQLALGPEDVAPPALVRDIPVDRFTERNREVHRGAPTQLALNLRGLD